MNEGYGNREREREGDSDYLKNLSVFAQKTPLKTSAYYIFQCSSGFGDRKNLMTQGKISFILFIRQGE